MGASNIAFERGERIYMRTYRGMLLATTSGLVAAAGGAQAADLPLKAAPIAAANWTGWYVGGHVGGAWTRSGITNEAFVPKGAVVDSSVFIGGGQIGYNWQRGNAVFGVEADISGLSD